MVVHSAVEHYWKSSMSAEGVREDNYHLNGRRILPHIITSNVEHDSVKLVAEHLVKMGKAGNDDITQDYSILCMTEINLFLVSG